ncbi:DUF4395 family protein [Candidatus Ruthia endofausta]|uniref:DUF4395 family protein n=1 Tax=Candidatus Ruthia endofausta TaxID=2738852 RepID=UPI001FE2B207|nr:DUF4395 family protein [Candidatus Ruthia endofausta]
MAQLGMWCSISPQWIPFLLASFLVIDRKPEWKPIGPKRYAWIIGASFISVCIVFFNPDAVAL